MANNVPSNKFTTQPVNKAPKPDTWLPASDAAKVLSDKHNRVIQPKYLRKLSQRRKRRPIRSKMAKNQFLYHRGDVEKTDIREIIQELATEK